MEAVIFNWDYGGTSHKKFQLECVCVCVLASDSCLQVQKSAFVRQGFASQQLVSICEALSAIQRVGGSQAKLQSRFLVLLWVFSYFVLRRAFPECFANLKQMYTRCRANSLQMIKPYILQLARISNVLSSAVEHGSVSSVKWSKQALQDYNAPAHFSAQINLQKTSGSNYCMHIHRHSDKKQVVRNATFLPPIS